MLGHNSIQSVKFTNERRHTWNDGEYLHESEQPDRAREILKRHEQQVENVKKRTHSNKLLDIFDQLDEADGPLPCSFCHI